MKKELKIVCLGGGVGTVQILRGLRKYTHNISVVVSMADDGGSAGRLRRLYSIPPPGDLINCLSSLSNAEPILSELLTYRFKGQRWGRDDSLEGQKLGNLILVALTKLTGSFDSALKEIQRIFHCHGAIYPATQENVSIWAETVEGKKVKGEVNIDLGKYAGIREIKKVHLVPENNTSLKAIQTALFEADIIISGPGDLYTTTLPVLLVNDIKNNLKKSKALKIFLINIANKPFETPNYTINNYLQAVYEHLDYFPFDVVIANKNHLPKIPAKLNYHYVSFEKKSSNLYNTKVLLYDLVNNQYPLYHDPDKVAKTILKLL